MPKSMVSAEHYNALKLERDQFAAHIERMKEELQHAAGQYVACDCKHPSCRYCKDRQDIDHVLAATPAQSLLIHDAEVLEKIVEDRISLLSDLVPGDSDHNRAYASKRGSISLVAMRYLISELRKQAEELSI